MQTYRILPNPASFTPEIYDIFLIAIYNKLIMGDKSNKGNKALGQRLKQYLIEHAMTQMDLERLSGIPQPQISDAVSGRRELSKNAIIAIKSAIPDLNLNWLFTGWGPMSMIVSNPVTEEPRIHYLRPPATTRIEQLESTVVLLLREVQALREEVASYYQQQESPPDSPDT